MVGHPGGVAELLGEGKNIHTFGDQKWSTECKGDTQEYFSFIYVFLAVLHVLWDLSS